MTIYAAVKQQMWKLFDSPDRGRLASVIFETWIDLDRQINSAETVRATSEAQTQLRHEECVLTEPWARAAYRLLLQAENCLANGDLQQGWVAVQATHRSMMLNPHDPEKVRRTAIALNREVDKLSGWRAKAIADLLSAPKGSTAPDAKIETMRVFDAVALRDDQFNTTYLKIALRRRHLWHLFYLLCLSISLVLLLSWSQLLPDFFKNDTKLLGLVILFGALGASISVALGLIRADISAKVPAQRIGAFVVWMRPAIGAAAALASFVILHTDAGVKLLELFHLKLDDPSALVVAFIAGFSERFIVGAIDRISEKSDKDRSS
jgi:hypothetical protein